MSNLPRTWAVGDRMLERPAISLEKDLLEEFDRLSGRRGYTNRSEALRDLIREYVLSDQGSCQAQGTAEQVAVVSMVRDTASRSAGKVAELQRENHKSIVSTVGVPIDEQHRLEVMILRGEASEIVALGEKLVSIKGIKHGKVLPTTTGPAPK